MKNKNCIYLSYMVKVKVLVTQSCSIFCDPMGCSPPSSSVHGIFQAILEWAAIPFSWGSSQPRDWTWVSCIAGRFFIVWATREAPFEIFIMYTFKNVCVYSFSKVIEVKSKNCIYIFEIYHLIVWYIYDEIITIIKLFYSFVVRPF